MPRETKNPIIAVLTYFRTAPLANVEVALELAKEEVRSRRNIAALRAPRPVPTETVATAASKPVRGKRRGRKPRDVEAVGPALPPQEEQELALIDD